jgi:TonB family protein
MRQPISRTGTGKRQSGLVKKQRNQLQIALAVLMVAFGILLVRDRDFWFGPNEAPVSDNTASQSASTAKSAAMPVKMSQASAVEDSTAVNHIAPKTSTKSVIVTHNDAAKPNSTKVAAKRPTLPALQVEVIAHDTRGSAKPASKVARVNLPSDSKRAATVTTSISALPINAAERGPLAGGNVPELRQTVDSTYPLLGPRMKVQGSVVLQAVIGADGSIENLHVMSGPAVLTTAAQQAVRQWHFKPYLQNGQAVETKATITVNFSIQISDNPAQTS